MNRQPKSLPLYRNSEDVSKTPRFEIIRVWKLIEQIPMLQSSSSHRSIPPKSELGGNTDRFWYPRFWYGMTFFSWLQLLKAGEYKIEWQRLPMILFTTFLALFVNSPLALLQKWFYRKKIRDTKLAGDPIFILGHMRSGTTLLHEYISQDTQFLFADTYACFTPKHFLTSRYIVRPIGNLLMPRKRVSDNMGAGLDRPQEDDWALMAIGLPSPLRNFIFPNNGWKIDDDYWTLRNVSAADRKTWLEGLDTFLKAVMYQHFGHQAGKRLVLKSPPHTGRIKALLEQYPSAKFVHIHRHPYSIFPSQRNLWMRQCRDGGAQNPTGEGLEEFIFRMFSDVFEAFAEDVEHLPANQFCDVGYEELIAAPVATLQKIYQTLELDGFESVKPVFEQYAESQKEYKKNKFALEPELKKQIAERWKGYFERYHYEV